MVVVVFYVRPNHMRPKSLDWIYMSYRSCAQNPLFLITLLKPERVSEIERERERERERAGRPKSAKNRSKFPQVLHAGLWLSPELFVKPVTWEERLPPHDFDEGICVGIL